MSAEGALDDPAIFGRAIAHAQSERSRLAAEVKRAKALKKEQGAYNNNAFFAWQSDKQEELV